MLATLELDENTLTRLTYHWFWGLRYHKTPQLVNLGIPIRELMKDKAQLAEIKARQNMLYKHHAVWRFFYWLVNYKNYLYHSYLLLAFKAHQNYLNPIKSEPVEMDEEYEDYKGAIAVAAAGLVAVIGALVLDGIKKHRRNAQLSSSAVEEPSSNVLLEQNVSDPVEKKTLWGYLSSFIKTRNFKLTNFLSSEEPPNVPKAVNKKARNLEEKQEEKTSTPASSKDKALVVTKSMVPHLNVLGIHRQSGDFLGQLEFTKSYKKKFLEVHPDKPGGDAQRFREAKDAVEALLKLMSINNTSRSMGLSRSNSDEFNEEEDAAFNEFETDLKHFEVDITEILAKIEANYREAAVNWREAAANSREAAANWREAAANSREAAANWSEAAANWREAAALCRENNAICDRIEILHNSMNADLARMLKQLEGRSAQLSPSSSPLTVVGSPSLFALSGEEKRSRGEEATPGKYDCSVDHGGGMASKTLSTPDLLDFLTKLELEKTKQERIKPEHKTLEH